MKLTKLLDHRFHTKEDFKQMRKHPTLTYDEIVASVPKAHKGLKHESYQNVIKGTYDRQKDKRLQKKDGSRYLHPPKQI